MDPNVSRRVNQSVTGIMFTPAEASALALANARRQAEIVDEDGVPFPLPQVAAQSAESAGIQALMPGDLCVILGRPSMGKSMIAQWWARKHAERLRDRRDEDRFVAFCTWEVAAEDIMLFMLSAASGVNMSDIRMGRVTPERMRDLFAAANRFVQTPLYLFGHSTLRRMRRPRMALQDIVATLDALDEGVVGDRQLKPALIVLDYLQRTRFSGMFDGAEYGQNASSRREQMMITVDQAKDMAFRYGCPVILLAQAGRQVDERRIKLPTMSDGQETSNLEQAPDVVLTVWKPSVTEPINSTIEIGANTYTVTDQMLLLALAKQKFGPTGNVFPLRVRPGLNEVLHYGFTGDHHYHR